MALPGWQAWPVAIYGMVALPLALFLLYLGFQHRANRAYAFLQLQFAIPILLGFTAQLAEDPWLNGFVGRVTPYFTIINFIALAYFVAVFPAPRARFLRSRWAFVPFLLVMVTVDLAYALDHTLWSDPSTAVPGPFGNVNEPQPLALFRSVTTLSIPVFIWLLARDYLRARPGPLRQSIFVVALGVPLLAVVQSMYGAVSRFAQGVATEGTPYEWFGTLEVARDIFRVAAIVAIVAWLAVHATRARDADARRGASNFALVFLAGAAVVAVQWAIAGADRVQFARIGTWLTGVLFLLGDLLVVYALLKYELFDIQVKVRFAIKQSTVAAAFIGVFFVVSELASSYFATSLGPFLGIAAAGMLVFAIAPIQHAAERLANAAVPDARSHAQLSRDERSQFYREHARLAWKDGVLTGDERDLLDHARERLGLSLEEATRLERDVRAELKTA